MAVNYRITIRPSTAHLHRLTIASYFRVFLTFARNSLVRDMTFRANFIIECIVA